MKDLLRTQIIDVLKRFSRADISQGQAADELHLMTEQQIIDRERLRCVRLCQGWIDTFKDRDIKYVGAVAYATDAINDIIDLITDGQDVGQQKPAGAPIQ